MGNPYGADESLDAVATAPEVVQTASQPVAAFPLQPLDDKVVIAPLEGEKISRGGIYIPDVAQEPSYQGVVMAVGPGAMLDNGARAPMDVVVGDTVLYKKYAGAEEIKIGTTKLIVVKNEMLLAKILA